MFIRRCSLYLSPYAQQTVIYTECIIECFVFKKITKSCIFILLSCSFMSGIFISCYISRIAFLCPANSYPAILVRYFHVRHFQSTLVVVNASCRQWLPAVSSCIGLGRCMNHMHRSEMQHVCPSPHQTRLKTAVQLLSLRDRKLETISVDPLS